MDAYDDTLGAFNSLIEWLSEHPDIAFTTVINGEQAYGLRNIGDYGAELRKRIERLSYFLHQLVLEGLELPLDYTWRRFRDTVEGGCRFEYGRSRVYDVEGQAEIRNVITAARDDLIRRKEHESKPCASARLKSSTPASNLATLFDLIGTSLVESVFDPYLDDQGLRNLTALASLGTQFSSNLQLLTSRGVINATLRAMVFKELECPQAEIRRTSGKEHRRFLLLQGGDSIVLGFSLNKFEHNEAIRREREPEDRTFFDAQWAVAVPV